MNLWRDRNCLAAFGMMLLAGAATRAQTVPATGRVLPVPAPAQSGSLPATAPTSVERQNPDRSNSGQSVSQLPSANPPVSQAGSHLAVTWNGIALQIQASNVPLSTVLRQIGEKTHMNISGGVPNERIFGSYGPGPLNLVVPELLNGLPLNVLLLERSGGLPDELILSARNGGPTPSSVPTQQSADQANGSTQPNQAYSGFGGPPAGQGANGFGPGRQGGNGQGGNGAPAVPGSVSQGTAGFPPQGDGNSSPNVNGQAASPNGVKTPQEIFEQLQRLRQQQGQPQ